jgi:uncharacterized protein
MLLRFQASNHRSILEPIELTMIAVDEDRPSVRRIESIGHGVLPVAGIYGPNASGKSNILEAIGWLSQAVARSLRAWEEVIPRDPFRFGAGPDLPSTYGVEMVVGGVRYDYQLEVSDSEVLFEALYSYPERRRRVLFERDHGEVKFRRGLGSLAATRELMTPTTLALSAAMRFDEGQIRAFGRALTRIGTLGSRRGRWNQSSFAMSPTMWLFEDRADSRQPSLFGENSDDRSEDRSAALSLLRFADLGIDDVKIVEEDVEVARTTARSREPRRRLQLLHRAAGQELLFDMEDESAGTQTWFRLIGPTLAALRRGGILLFDEIDASLHPRLSVRLLELFQDRQVNPLGAQLIFTSHDTSLLNHLNRDEVWLTEKGATGTTELTALADYGGDKVRRSLNLERAYLQGRFGAVPELDQQLIHYALGLSERGPR